LTNDQRTVGLVCDKGSRNVVNEVTNVVKPAATSQPRLDRRVATHDRGHEFNIYSTVDGEERDVHTLDGIGSGRQCEYATFLLEATHTAIDIFDDVPEVGQVSGHDQYPW
jgi:hypothetical protein